MRIIDTSTIGPDTYLSPDYNDWIYCFLDSAVTAEIHPKLEKLDNENTSWIYKFQMACRVPALAMMMEGILIDQEERGRQTAAHEKERERLWRHLQAMADAVWDQPLNPNSSSQMIDFFYGCMQLHPIYRRRGNGDKTLTCDREALEKLSVNFSAFPIIDTILAIKELDGLLRVLRSGVDPDGRMRTSFNVGATVTGRWSSSKNVYKTGTNMQNITPAMRKMFIADRECLLAYPDLEQAESRAVAYLSEDLAYIKACESFDLHTTVAMLVWPELPWTRETSKDAQRYNKKDIAGRLFYRHFTYRDMAKRGGHGTNYYGTPFTMARHLRVATKVMEEFQARYFAAFGGIPRWHLRVAQDIQTTSRLITALGRERTFFDRTDRDETLRSAIAHEPQSLVGDILNAGILQVWRHYWRPEKADIIVYPLAQVHDAGLFRIPLLKAEALSFLTKAFQQLMEIPISVRGRTMIIPVEVKYGFNWQEMHTQGDELDALLANPPQAWSVERFLAQTI